MPFLFGMEACEHKLIFQNSGLRWFFLLAPNRGKIVSRISAGCYFGRVTEIPGTDHFSIVKPDGFNHPSHGFLVTFYDRFTAFLEEYDFVSVLIGHSESTGQQSSAPPMGGPARELRRNLLSAENIEDLQLCRAQTLAALARRPENAELILLRDQVEDALAREIALNRHRSRLNLATIGTALAFLFTAIILLTMLRGPDVAITSISKGTSVSGEARADIFGTVSHINSQSSVYVLYRSETWTASKAEIASDGSWMAHLGRWNDVTNETAPSTAELSVLVTRKPLEEQGIATAGEGVFLIPSNRLQDVVGKQARPIEIQVKPLVHGESLRMQHPRSGAEVRGTESFEAEETVTGSVTCIYVLHRTPSAAVWAAHPATVDGEGFWSANLGRWNDHNWIHLGLNEIMAVSLKPEYCKRDWPGIPGDWIEQLSNSKSPIVRVDVEK